MAYLRSIRSFVVTLGVAALLGLCQSAAAQTRPLQLSDWYDLKNVGDFSVSPDSRTVAFLVREIDRDKDRRTASLWRIATAGGAAERLTWEGSASAPRFSPDGRYLGFITTRHLERAGTPKKVAERGQVWILPLAGGEAFPMTALKEGVDSFEWAPDSSRLAVVSRDPRDEEGDETEKQRHKKRRRQSAAADRHLAAAAQARRQRLPRPASPPHLHRGRRARRWRRRERRPRRGSSPAARSTTRIRRGRRTERPSPSRRTGPTIRTPTPTRTSG
jgi:dipeptidyl aminopeptidase/acylaminoacyl peptidase